MSTRANHPSVSIVIPAFGRPERLRALLGELQKQVPIDGGFEVIVVDDGSPEPIAPSVADLISPSPFSLQVIRQENGGPSSARNRGAASARGEYLLFVDDDLLVPADLVQCHLRIQNELGPALLNCELEWRIEAEPEPFAVWYRRRTAEWGRSRSDEGRPVADGVLEITAPSASTANLSLPRALFESLGGFDPEYPYGCEDQDLAGRADRAGLLILFTDRTRAIHIETHNTLRKLCQRQRQGTRDTVRFLKRFAVEHHVGQPEVARHNDPIDWRRDPATLRGKKMFRWVLSLSWMAPVAFGAIRVVERLAPHSSWLPRIYDVMVAAFAQKGWREGLKLHREVEPLEAWKPVDPAAIPSK
jgi:GT2 family glycosyltransferase